MSDINTALTDLKRLFKTDRIYNESSLTKITDDELNEIIDLITVEKTDDIFVVSKRLELDLSSGRVFLRDREQE